jgi:hypothetical protein
MTIELEEFAPNRYRVKRTPQIFARSEHPLPYVISDSMPPLEHVDGRFYTSKRQYSAVTRAHGLIEVGNEKFKPKKRSTDLKATKDQRRQAIRKAIELTK